LIWPLTSLGFVITALAAKLVLKEEVSWVRWCGVILIVIGAGVITWSEKMKERQQAVAPAASARPANQ
jgi:drug/metabolite transporter (DMT)-like permease